MTMIEEIEDDDDLYLVSTQKFIISIIAFLNNGQRELLKKGKNTILILSKLLYYYN